MSDKLTARQLSQKEADIPMMLAADVNFGIKNCDFQKERYIFKLRNDGVKGKTIQETKLAGQN